MKRIGLAIIFYLLNNNAFSQSDQTLEESKIDYWMSGGIHSDFVYNSFSMQGIQLGENLSFDKRYLLQLTQSYSMNFFQITWPFGPGGDNVMTHNAELSLLGGLDLIKTQRASFRAYSGITIGHARFRGQSWYENNNSFGPDIKRYEYDIYDYFGLPLDFSFFIKSNDWQYISLDVYTNWNKYPSFGVAINLHSIDD